MTEEALSQTELIAYTSDIVAAYASENEFQQEDVPALIRNVFATLKDLAEGAEEEEVLEPAVSIRASVKPDYLVCLEDGKKLKMLKRYLKTKYDMTPAEYRERWGLPSGYPMVAPNYTKQRSELAKSIGLGQKRKGAGLKKK